MSISQSACINWSQFPILLISCIKMIHLLQLMNPLTLTLLLVIIIIINNWSLSLIHIPWASNLSPFPVPGHFITFSDCVSWGSSFTVKSVTISQTFHIFINLTEVLLKYFIDCPSIILISFTQDFSLLPYLFSNVFISVWNLRDSFNTLSYNQIILCLCSCSSCCALDIGSSFSVLPCRFDIPPLFGLLFSVEYFFTFRHHEMI